MMSYGTYNVVRWVVAVVVFGLAICTIFKFANTHRQMSQSKTVIILWALAPPLWFFWEYWLVDHDWITSLPGAKDAMLESVKTYADYASKIWAAVLAAVLFLVKKE
jgi:hypothetical protein